MSKKKSETLDETLIAQPKAEKSAGTKKTGNVSLKEFSKNAAFSFNAKNYKVLLTGLGINVLGFILMIGGATDDPAEFHEEELFSHMRITIAPFFIVLGYVVIMYGIMKKPKSEQ